MYESTQNLELFRQLIYCAAKLPLWTYRSDGTLAAHTPEIDRQWEHFFLMDQTDCCAMEYARTGTAPLVLTNSLNMMWIAAFVHAENELQFFHVIGPIFIDDISMDAMRRELNRRKIPFQTKQLYLQMIPDIPVLSFTTFMQYGIMLHYCATGEQISTYQFQYQTMPEEVPHTQSDQEIQDRHGSWAMEQNLCRLVEDGNLNYKDVMQNQSLNATVGKLSVGDPMRQAKNTIIAGIIIISRAAMRGGLYPDLAYSLSDKYIQAVECCTTIPDVMNIHHTALQDFVQRVHDAKAADYPSSFVKDCQDYVSAHLSDALSLEEIAANLGYTPYYLARKYKKDTGTELRIYIRNERLEYSRNLLLYTHDSIHDISEKLHFCSQSYYTEHFRERFGLTPAQYRAKC